ncbi:hypothetical protein [uncultured Victivallis sp.]|uniref:GH39 family glycosyl hydrolase n=1 Tax=uncultured Victivallis sp. TaxID=354118 RepID=UPI002585CEAC|nr:hypothetical protein [uncultured Victivallis sp.]
MKLFTLVFAALAALLSVPAPAAELMKLDIDFGHPAWRGVVTPLWGGLPEVERNGNTAVLAFGPGSFCGTPLIPCPPGSVVEIAFDASATAIAPGGEAWRTAAVQLGLFDGTAEQSHLDLFNTGRATPFRRYESRTPVSGNGFRLCFGNYGRSGTFRIANLSIRIMVPGRNVERDGSFSGMFGINDWFVQKGGVDWDGLGLGSFEHAKVVKNAFPGAGSTLELDGGATVVSRQFPYNGEGLVVGGWFRQAGIARPEDGRPWAHAGIQLVFFDRDDNVIGHDDVTRQLLPGDRPWGYHVIEISPGGLSPKVKSVALYLRIWGGTAGKAWFDELAVVKQGEGQARNYDSSKGVIAVGPAGEAAELVRVWNGVDLSYCSQIDLPQVRTALRRLKEEGGLEYLRTREFFNGPFPVKSIDAAGNMTYDFSTVDKYLDYPVKELGLKLVPTIETVPPQLRRDSGGHVPKDFALWGRAVKALVRHWIGRYGREEVSQWVFECWNEPGSDFFRGTDEEFCRLFVAYLEALTGVEKECGIKLRIGTPSGAMNNLLSRAMEAARRAGLDGAVTDASTHIYGGFAGAMELYRIGIEDVRKRMEPFPAGRGVPVHVTEFNGSAMGSRHFDTQTGAAFVVKANRLMADEGVLRTYFYCAIDHPYLNLEHHYSTDLGYMTHYDAVPKPSFNALVLLNRLEGKRLPVKASSEPFDAMAAVAGDGTMRIVVTTFSEEELGAAKPVPVTLEIDWAGRPEKLGRAELVRIDSAHANSYAAFEKAGKPSYRENPDTAAYREAAKLVPEALQAYRFENGKLIIPLVLELNSVAAVTVK